MRIKDLFCEYRRGNILVSGMSNMGAEECFLEMAKSCITDYNHPVFLSYDRLTEGGRRDLLETARRKGYKIYELGYGECTEYGFDLLSGFRSVNETANSLYGFLSKDSDDFDKKEKIVRFLKDCILALKGDKRNIREILRMRPDDIVRGIEESDELDRYDIEDECDFIESADGRAIWGLINDRSRILKNYKIDKFLSGGISVRDFFHSKVFINISNSMVGGDTGSLYSICLNGMLGILSMVCKEKIVSEAPFHIFLGSSSKVKDSIMKDILAIGQESECMIPVFVYEQSVEEMLRAHIMDVLQYFEWFGVFKTREGQFWSEFFGTTLQAEVTSNYSRSLLDRIFNPKGGVIERNQRGTYTGQNIHRVEKPRYEARIFTDLRERCFMFYDVVNNRKGRSNI